MALDCLSYHATASDNDTVWLARERVPPAQEFNLYSYKFNDTQFGDSTTLKIVLRMFMDFDLMNKFSIPHNVVCRWALSVKKNYRPVKYHNWRHALNVCQTMFTVLKTGKMERFMEDMEVFGLLVACLCHDLDHRGTNNSYQTKVNHLRCKKLAKQAKHKRPIQILFSVGDSDSLDKYAYPYHSWGQ